MRAERNARYGEGSLRLLRVWGAVVACALAGLAPSMAKADEARSGVVAVQAATCEGPQYQASLMRALEVELTALDLEPRWAARARGLVAARVSVRRDCGAPRNQVELAIWMPAERLAYERALGLGDVPAQAHARTLALLIAETLSVVSKGPASSEPAPAAAAPARFAPEPSSLFVARPPKPTGPSSAASPVPASNVAPIVRPRRAGARPLSSLPLYTRRPPYPFDDALFTAEDPYPEWSGLQLGLGGLARFAPLSTDVLLGMELSGSAPLAKGTEWAFEASYCGGSAWGSERDYSVGLASAAVGVDMVAMSIPRLTFGPRLALGHLHIAEPQTSLEGLEESTLVTFLGARAELGTPLSDHVSMDMTFAADCRLGVLALTRGYQGLDRALGGLLFYWTVGVSVEP